jgi:putative lipoic acid-binding regulatory protein
VIASHKEHIETAVAKICVAKDYELKHSNNSKTGKYVSMSFSTLVSSEDERVEIFEQLRQSENIKMVL